MEDLCIHRNGRIRRRKAGKGLIRCALVSAFLMLLLIPLFVSHDDNRQRKVEMVFSGDMKNLFHKSTVPPKPTRMDVDILAANTLVVNKKYSNYLPAGIIIKIPDPDTGKMIRHRVSLDENSYEKVAANFLIQRYNGMVLAAKIQFIKE